MYVLGLGDYASPILGKRRSSFAEVPFISFVCCGAEVPFRSFWRDDAEVPFSSFLCPINFLLCYAN